MCHPQDCGCVLPIDYGKTLAAHLLHADFVILLRCFDEPGCLAYPGTLPEKYIIYHIYIYIHIYICILCTFIYFF